MQTGTHPGLRPPLRGGEQDLSPLGRGAAQAAGWVVPFVRCRRAAATALTAAVMTLMSVAGIALTSDHTHLVYQRDILKAGTDAATLATTRHLWTLGQNLSDEQVKAALMPIARRYILANISESRRERAAETLTVTLVSDRTAGTVDITAEADLGGIIFGSWMYGNVVPSTRVGSLSELEIADETTTTTPTPDTPTTPSTPPITELALVLDVTGSMTYHLTGDEREGPDSRIEIVKRAAEALVDTITSDTSRTVAVGLVPWSYRVRFDTETRTRWEDSGWALYPTRRYYPNPYQGSWRWTGTSPYPDPHQENPWGEWHDLPNRGSKSWNGCVDQRRMSGDNPPGIHATPPTLELFTMSFYTPTVTYPLSYPVSFQCHDAPRTQSRCYSDSSHNGYSTPQQECDTGMPPIVPLTTNVATIKQKIESLWTSGSATYSTLGVAWGHRLLVPAWRNIWSDDSVHPVDAASNVRKVLVLLTDGEDNHLRGVVVRDHRRQACTAAKEAGIEIITVFAGNPGSSLKDELLACASPVTDEDATNSFTGTTQEELEGAFETIGQRLRPLRLMR